MKTWEYKKETLFLKVNQLANSGWKVIAVFMMGNSEFKIPTYLLERELKPTLRSGQGLEYGSHEKEKK